MYKVAAAGYWTSLLLVQAVGWALLAGAVFRLRRGWQEEREETTVPAPTTAAEGEAEAAQPSCRPLDEGTNPIAWLLQRQRGLKTILWLGALAGISRYWVVLIMARLIGATSYWSVASPLTLVMTVVSGALFAWGASRFFVEARRTGELELLLTTPLGATQIVSTQWEVLKRALWLPLAVMLLPGLLQAGLFMLETAPGYGLPPGFMVQYSIGQLFFCLNTVLAVVLLCWLGMWFGLRASGQGRAVAWTVAIGAGVPYLIGLLSWLIFIPFFGPVLAHHWIWSWLLQVVDLAFYLVMLRLVRRRLLGGLAAAELMKWDLRESISAAVREAVSAWRKVRHWTPR